MTSGTDERALQAVAARALVDVVAGRVAVMTARPGRIKCEITVDLPHPRHYTIKTAPVFSALKARLTEEIRVEALRASMTAADPLPHPPVDPSGPV